LRYVWIPVGVALALLLAGADALAGDGVIEINQVRAQAGGVSPGDAPGFPVTITQSGHFRLTSNLDTAGGYGGIEITSGNVTVDLNGFTVLCSNAAVCLDSSFSRAVAVNAAALQNITVRNGMVRGFLEGVVVGNYSLVEKITATGIKQFAIVAWVASAVRDCVVTGNAGTAILVGGGSLVVGNVIADNGLGLCNSSTVPAALRGNILAANVATYCPGSSPSFRDAGGNVCNGVPGICP
jgi:hypothetical protein